MMAYLSLMSINTLTFTEWRRGGKLLRTLADLIDHIFVTTHVFEEVQKGKFALAEKFWEEQLRKRDTFDFPDHVFSETDDKVRRARESLKEVQEGIERVKLHLKETASDALAWKCGSEDEISKSLTCCSPEL
jgi:hypothetical protein